MITHDISTVLNTSQRNAEQLKRDHGYADSRQASDEVQLAVDVVGKNQPVNYSEKYLAEVIEARVRQIFERSQKKLQSINAPQLPGAWFSWVGSPFYLVLKKSLVSTTMATSRCTFPTKWGFGTQVLPWPLPCANTKMTCVTSTNS